MEANGCNRGLKFSQHIPFQHEIAADFQYFTNLHGFLPLQLQPQQWCHTAMLFQEREGYLETFAPAALPGAHIHTCGYDIHIALVLIDE